MTKTETITASEAAPAYAKLSENLSLEKSQINENENSGTAVRAEFITPLDPVVETADGNRLPAIPLDDAHKLNILKEKVENGNAAAAGQTVDEKEPFREQEGQSGRQDVRLDISIPNLRTHPLFPPLPLYGPPSFIRNVQCMLFRITSFFLSTGFLLVVVLGAVFTSIPSVMHRVWLWLTFRNPDKTRPFYDEERRRAEMRDEANIKWYYGISSDNPKKMGSASPPNSRMYSRYGPREGGPDKLVCDARYYARRVGLSMEKFKVQTEDGFILDLWHVYDPDEPGSRLSEYQERGNGPEKFMDSKPWRTIENKGRYPVLLIHGLLQSAGAYCCNDDDSLAFYLHKSGYDVWLGNNRCGFSPEHTLLKPSDPRMWAWNIRQMGVMDLPAFVSRILNLTGFSKLGLVAHSQGTTETFVALAKQQRPDLGEKISVFCALAPAVYAGPLIGKMYFKFMKVISPAMFRLFFGIHTFIPLMMTMHTILPARLYGLMGYLVFSFLFNWSDKRWDKGLRDRAFQFAPVHVSSESMRWWLGRECFAKHKCVLSTTEEHKLEEEQNSDCERAQRGRSNEKDDDDESRSRSRDKGRLAWYDERSPPFALWVCGSDDLVDGRKLLHRFTSGREPYVKLVHSKIIEEYEHLDVLWAVDAIDRVGSEVKDVIWRTMSEHDRQRCYELEDARKYSSSST